MMEKGSSRRYESNARRFERKPFKRTVNCSVSIFDENERKTFNLKARAVDISIFGIGIETDYPLSPGNNLWFKNGIERGGVVKWCIKVENDYRVGIKLSEDRFYAGTALQDTDENILQVGTEVEKYYTVLDEATDAFNARLNELEEKAADPRHNPDEVMSELTGAIDAVLSVCKEFEGAVADQSLIRDARIRFREKTNPILSKSYCINRARTWPLGHQGDHKTLEIVYKNTPLSDGLGYYLDLYGLSMDLGIGVRERLISLRESLRRELLTRQNPKVLDIACGSCREVFELVPEIHKSGAKFTCIDLDSEALNFSLNRLSYAQLPEHQIEFRKYNALRMFDVEMALAEFGRQDVIYSVGFFDYLPDDFLVKLFNSLYAILNAGGRLIASFKDADRYRHQDYHWIVDWDGFLQRRTSDFEDILSGAQIPSSAITESRVDSGTIIFYNITKPDETTH